jgi:membrane-associated phospholipid phosphatase
LTDNFKNHLARIVSILFVPPSFTIILFTYFAFTLENDLTKRIVLLIVVFTFGFSFHIILFFYLRMKGKLVDYDASIKEERTFPYIVSTLIYICGLAILLLYGINIISTAFWFCYISNTILIMMINKSWKISAHTMGASGPLAALCFAAGWQSLLFLPLIILIGWSRLYRKVHTLAQVVAGVLVGFISTYLQMYIIVNLF